MAGKVGVLPAVGVTLDPQGLDEAVDEALFIDQREVEKREQQHFEQAIGQLERFVDAPCSSMTQHSSTMVTDTVPVMAYTDAELERRDRMFDAHPIPSATLADLSRTRFEEECVPAAVARDVVADNGEQLLATLSMEREAIGVSSCGRRQLDGGTSA